MHFCEESCGAVRSPSAVGRRVGSTYTVVRQRNTAIVAYVFTVISAAITTLYRRLVIFVARRKREGLWLS